MAATDSLTPKQLLEQFKAEVESFMQARLSRDKAGSLRWVEHALTKAVTLDGALEEQDPTYRDVRDKDPDGLLMTGIRYARNRSIHQFADIIFIRNGASFPIVFPSPFHEVIWKATADIPKSANPKFNSGEEVYTNELALKEVRFTFDALLRFFAAHAR